LDRIGFTPCQASRPEFFWIRTVTGSTLSVDALPIFQILLSTALLVPLSPRSLIGTEFVRVVAPPSDGCIDKWFGIFAVSCPLESVATIAFYFSHPDCFLYRLPRQPKR
jgi:hypothetical protein